MDARFAIPVPIDHAQNSAVLATYQRIANAAHDLIGDGESLRYPGQDLVDAAARAFRDAPSGELPSGRIYTLPEAVAQMASYVRSLEKKPGVHGVIDVGAGTTDVSVFSFRAADGGRPVWYSALAIPRAAAFVQQAVARSLTGLQSSR